MSRAMKVLLAASVATCGACSSVDAPRADCARATSVVHGDSTFTVTAWYPETSAVCRGE